MRKSTMDTACPSLIFVMKGQLWLGPCLDQVDPSFVRGPFSGWGRESLRADVGVGAQSLDQDRSGWVLGCSVSWISLGPPFDVGPTSSPPHSLRGLVSACWCIGGSRCPGLTALVRAGSLPVAACQGLGPLALSGLCLGSDVPRGLRSLGPWLDLLQHRRLPAGPVGSWLQLPGLFAQPLFLSCFFFFLFVSVSVSIAIEIIPEQFLIKFLL
ncbi:hypothetical protein ATANTOWER_020053 [Ataeniobius toweri]|uniref:Uncharacterized protein n=1 Tax=Ataeniobius toweri TaxID=208326 RepID=A0ABU7A835_9TELE|nr:hypothetical protein [Ataeniobius toweri]